MCETLSFRRTEYDYSIVMWLIANYIEPFGRIDRQDGLVVTKDDDR